MAHKSLPLYNRIKQNILHSPVVGGDKTGVKVNGKKAWFCPDSYRDGKTRKIRLLPLIQAEVLNL